MFAELRILCFIIATACIPPLGIIRADDAKDFFTEKVEPLLRAHCYACHSHGSGQMEGGLVLDWKSGWAQGGSRGPAIIPSRPDESLLIRAVEHSDPDLMMPEEKLSPQEIQILRDWVQHGAYDDRHVQPESVDPLDWWSLKPLVAPPIPLDRPNPIDAFIYAQLHSSGLERSTIATPRERIRRLYYDLVGLPPDLDETQEFLRTPSEENYLRIVDHLLNSPQYGERWARHWLDTIHFADSHGYEHDVGRDNAWPYRDYVIQALNSDTRWDRFIRQQIAVVVFEPEATNLIPALGFLGAGTFDLSTYSTGPITFDYLDRDDMLTQTMAAFVSATANCARCHAHKFDPITQEDYYALQAVFSGIIKGNITYDSDPATAAKRKQLLEIKQAAQNRNPLILASDFTRQLIRSEIEHQQELATWTPLEFDSYLSLEGATITKEGEHTYAVSGVSPATDTYVLSSHLSLQQVTALRLDVLPHDSLPMKGPGRCENGNLHLSEVSISLFHPDQPMGKKVPIVRASADFNQADWGIERAIDGDSRTAWGIYPEVGKPHHAVFDFAEPLPVDEHSLLTITLKQLHGGSHLIGAFRLSVTDAPPERTVAFPKEVEHALKVAEAQRSPEQHLTLSAYFAEQAADRELAMLPAQQLVYAAGPHVSIPAGNGTYQAASIVAPKQVHLLERGEISKPRQQVLPGALSVLTHSPARFESINLDSEPQRRAALANWLAHPDNVLTWRSAVNRVWHYHFGQGLCDTPSDLGRMGGVPSHPELIDWLAIWFRDDAGGSLKKLHRLIVTSQTYQQSSEDRNEAQSVDAQNRLLWKQNRLRLDADAFRDYVLSISGRLDLAKGGSAIQHFKQQPGPQSTPKLDYAAYDWSTPHSNRRSIYRYVWRGIPDPLMSAMDFPDLGLLAPTRTNSASPLQALALLNNSFVLYHAQQTAERLGHESADLEEQIRLLTRWAYQREPDTSEGAAMRLYAENHGLAALCRIVFNSNEFLFLP
ncbi:PSD1 and planctomycete cytochrome C domain-containing protein [Pirellulaceae bacterium SH449]